MSKKSRWAFSAVILAASITAATPVLADNVSDAQAKFKAGATAYREARYKDAIDLFLQANKLDPHPELVFNVGQAYEKIGDVSAALRSYRDYLRLAPNADDRATVERSIKNLEMRLREKGLQQVTVFSDPARARVFLDGIEVGSTPTTFDTRPGKHVMVIKSPGRPDSTKEFLLTEDKSMDIDVTLPPIDAVPMSTGTASASATGAGTGPVATGTAPAPDAPTGIAAIKPWTWAAFGVGVIGFGTAIGLEAARAGAESAARNDPTQVGYKEHYDQMLSNQLGARIMIGIGAAGIAAGGLLLFLDLRPKAGVAAPGSPVKQEAAKAAVATPVLGVGCSGGGCGATVRGSF